MIEAQADAAGIVRNFAVANCAQVSDAQADAAGIVRNFVVANCAQVSQCVG